MSHLWRFIQSLVQSRWFKPSGCFVALWVNKEWGGAILIEAGGFYDMDLLRLCLGNMHHYDSSHMDIPLASYIHRGCNNCYCLHTVCALGVSGRHSSPNWSWGWCDLFWKFCLFQSERSVESGFSYNWGNGRCSLIIYWSCCVTFRLGTGLLFTPILNYILHTCEKSFLN